MLTSALFSHSLINGLVRKGVFADHTPSYISSRTFAMAVLDIVSPVEYGRKERSSASSKPSRRPRREASTKATATTLKVLIDDASSRLGRRTSPRSAA
jgi:hypothetical protein